MLDRRAYECAIESVIEDLLLQDLVWADPQADVDRGVGQREARNHRRQSQ